MSSRTWVKINCDRWFDGTIRKEPIEMRSLWTDVLALAGRTGTDGVIRLPGTEIGYTDEQLAQIFNVDIEIWLRCKERLSNHPDGPHENRISVNDGNKIEIISWKHYQSEYVRQLSYREKLQQKVTIESDSRKCGERREEKNREEKNIKDLKDFCPPTIAEVVAYAREKGLKKNPLEFHSYWEARDWRFKNGKRMSKWKAAQVNNEYLEWTK